MSRDPAPRVLVVSPDVETRSKLAVGLRAAGFREAPLTLDEYPARNVLEKKLVGERVDALLVDLSREELGLAVLQSARAGGSKPLTLAVNGSRKLSTVVRARGAGAWGYLTNDYDLRPLAEHFGIASPAPSEGPGRLIAFVGAKGGCGSSTAALHASAAIAARLGGSSLLLDLDPCTGIIAFQLGLEPKKTLADVLAGEISDDSAWDAAIVRWGPLDVIPGVFHYQDHERSNPEAAGRLIDAVLNRYRVAVLDCPAALSPLIEEFLRRADRVYLVATPEIAALHLAKRKSDWLRAAGVGRESPRLLMNRVGSWGAPQTERIERIVGMPVDWALDNDYASVRRASWEGGLVASNSALGRQLEGLAQQLAAELDLQPQGASEPAADSPTAVGS